MAAHRNTAYLQNLYEALASIDDPKVIEELLIDLCTTTEVGELAKRLAVAQMLAAGSPYTAIQKETGASAATIARVSRFLSEGAGGYAKVLEKLNAAQAAKKTE